MCGGNLSTVEPSSESITGACVLRFMPFRGSFCLFRNAKAVRFRQEVMGGKGGREGPERGGDGYLDASEYVGLLHSSSLKSLLLSSLTMGIPSSE